MCSIVVRFSVDVCFSEGLYRNKTCLEVEITRGCETIEPVHTVLLVETRCVGCLVPSELRLVVLPRHTAHR